MAQRARFFDSQGVAITLANPSSAADDIIDTTIAHGFVAGQPVHFTALTGGAGLSVGVIYWVTATSLGAQTFRIAASPGGVDLGFTTDITAGTVVGGDRVYDSAAWAQVVAGMRTNGVADTGNEMAVSESSPAAMSVRVNTGRCFVEGYYHEVYSAQETLTIAAAHATLARIDRVVVRRDLTGRQAILAVLTGTPAGSPVAPALTQNPAGTFEISLAQVLVPAAAASIVDANITDERGVRSHDPYTDSALAGALAPSSLTTAALVGSGKFDLTNAISPATITGNVDDYNPAGLATASVLRLAIDATGRELRGLQAPSPATGKFLMVIRVDTLAAGTQLVIMHDKASSAAANRILISNNVTPDSGSRAISPNGASMFWYDVAVSRWRMMGSL